MTNAFTGTPNEVYDKALQWFREQGLFKTEGSLDCTLDSIPGLQIHPIFAIEKFEPELSAKTYKHMEPALLLASLFITDPRVQDMPFKLGLATNKDIERDKLGHYLKVPEAYNNKTPEQRTEHWEIRLNDLAQNVTWRFSSVRTFHKRFGWESQGVTYLTKRQRDAYITTAEENPSLTKEQIDQNEHVKKEVSIGLKEIGFRKAHIDAANPGLGSEYRANDIHPSCMLHKYFKTYFEDPSTALQGVHNAKEHDVCFQFQFAVTVCHELMHCVQFTPNPLGILGKKSKGLKAPWYSIDELHEWNDIGKPELGLSWERELFGGPTGFVSMTYSVVHKNLGDFPRLLLTKMIRPELKKKLVEKENIRDANSEIREMTSDHKNFRQTLVPLSWIASWFKKEHWEEDRTTANITTRPPSDRKINLLVASTRGLSVEEGEDPLEKEKEHLERSFVKASCYSPSVPLTEGSPSRSSKEGSSPDHSPAEASSSPVEVTKTDDENDNEGHAHDDGKRKINSSPSEEGRRPSKSTKLDDGEGAD